MTADQGAACLLEGTALVIIRVVLRIEIDLPRRSVYPSGEVT